jgi:predicted RNA binding protein YcfA (HicA-like mRNA interferase family)
MRIILRMGTPHIETATTKITARLKREGWLVRHGGSHDVFEHPERPDVRIVVPRHRTLKPGVARQIARVAGWLEKT